MAHPLVGNLIDATSSALKSIFPGGTIFNIFLILGTFGGEQFFRRLSFDCPCAYPQNQIYAMAFILAPALALFIIGIVVNQTTWRLLQGCCYRAPRTHHGLRRACYYWIRTTAQALVAPSTWLFIAFLDGGYYECLASGQFCSVSRPGRNVSASTSADSVPYGQGTIDPMCVCRLAKEHPLDSRFLRARSQVIAWGLLLFGALVVFAYMFTSKVLDRHTYVQNYYVNLYRELEEAEFQKEARKRACELAQTNSKKFFDKKKRSKLDWDKVSVVPLNQYPFLMRGGDLSKVIGEYLTPLDTWSKESEHAQGTWHDAVERSLNNSRQNLEQIERYDDSDDGDDVRLTTPLTFVTDDDGKRRLAFGNRLKVRSASANAVPAGSFVSYLDSGVPESVVVRSGDRSKRTPLLTKTTEFDDFGGNNQ